MRCDEIGAARALEHYFRNALRVPVSWSEGRDPPDCDFTIGIRSYNVEITTLTPQYARQNSKPISFLGWRHRLEQIAECVTYVAKSKGYLAGYYLLEVSEPRSDEDLAKTKYELIKDSALAFVRDTRFCASHERHDLAPVCKLRATIEKVPISANRVAVIPKCMTRWQGEITSELQELVRMRVEEKTRKMAHLVGEKLLVLNDRYNFADAEDYRQATKSCDASAYRGIFVVCNGLARQIWGNIPFD